MERDELREELAALVHEQWSGWMDYMFDLWVRVGDLWVMSNERAERWQRQMCTSYADLSDAEKDSDRVEADRILALLARVGRAHD